jgi:hypothetical protein
MAVPAMGFEGRPAMERSRTMRNFNAWMNINTLFEDKMMKQNIRGRVIPAGTI